jgi:hypothetical protein
MKGLHIVFVCWQRYTFAIFSVHVGQCLCDVRGSCGPRGANKPTPSVTGDESRSCSTCTTILHPPHFSCHLMPAVDPSISRNHAHIPRWRGEAMRWSFAMSCWRPLSGGERIFVIIKHSEFKRTCNKNFHLPNFTFSSRRDDGGR